MKKVFKCTIEVMSPVHVGCDEVYEPTSFVVDEMNRQLIHFKPSIFLAGLDPNERNRFSAICRKGTINSILEMYKFFRGKTAEGRRVDLCSGFLDHYRKTLSIPEGNSRRIQQELNKFSIQRTAFRSVDNRPYLPGSSIKGALRTGYLNAKCQGKKIPHPPRSSSGGYSGKNDKFHQYAEKKLLNYNQIEEDPFGKVKISDFQPIGEVKTTIIYAVNQKKKISDKDARGPYQIFEVIQPGTLFQGEIEVSTSVFPNPLTGVSISVVKEPVQLNGLLSGAFDFYRNEHRRENRELAAVRIPPLDLTRPFSNASKSCNASDYSGEPDSSRDNSNGKNIQPLRIGLHSGAECVTIDGNRNIKIMLGKKGNKVLDHATTLWLASDKQKAKTLSSLRPFGWIVLEALTPLRSRSIDSQEKEYTDRITSEANERAALIQAQIRIEKEAKRLAEEKEAENRRQQKAAEQLKQTLESMGKEERFIFKFDQGTILEEQVNLMFKQIDEVPENFKTEIASRLTMYWKDHQMWTKKQAGRQWKKVRERNNKLEEILGLK